MSFFSIVIPAYNVAPYIEQCINSVIHQSFTDFEIIAVNDASTDDTAQILSAMAKQDSRIHVINKPVNGGRHAARRSGIVASTGNWILFLDGDDEFAENALVNINRSIGASGNADIVRYGLSIAQEDSIDPLFSNDMEKKYNRSKAPLYGDEILYAMFSDRYEERILWTCVCAAVKRSVAVTAFAQMTTNRLERLEDAYEAFVISACAKSMVFDVSTPALIYHWGRGVTGTQRQRIEYFIKTAYATRQVMVAFGNYAESHASPAVQECYEWLAQEIPQHVSTEMVMRVSEYDEESAALAFARAWGTDVVLRELARLIRDRARHLLDNGILPSDGDELWRLQGIFGMIDVGVRYRTIVPMNTAGFRQLKEEANSLVNRVQHKLIQRGDPAKGSATAQVIDSDNAKRLAIYCFYDRNGHAASFIDYFLRDLMYTVTDLVVVVNGQLDGESRKLFEKYTNRIIIRENKGLDAAAYKQVMLTLGWKKLEEYDEVLCLNDTVLGPVYPFEEMFRKMDRRAVDFWGITAYHEETVNDEFIPTHLQAYWHAYRRSLVSSQAFHEYWENLPLWESYADVTHKHEIPFTAYFVERGFSWCAYVDQEEYKDISPYPLLYVPKQLIERDRCPVFKRRSFFVDYDVYFDQTAGQPALDLYDYLKDHTTFDVNLIWDAILQSYNIEDIRKNMHLDYVLPLHTLNPRENERPSSAFIYHIYFLDLLDDTYRYLAEVPEQTDLYITTTADKIDTIREYLTKRGMTRHVEFIAVKNRGRDVSALLVAAKDVVLNGKYEVVGFAHDKKSSQNQESGHHGTETQGFAYKLMENTLGSRDYVENILTLFANNPRLGLACPPPPYHALYFAHTIPTDWGPNFKNTKDLIEKRLKLRVPLDESKATMSAMGSCYWFRVDALRPLFAWGWHYEDFLPEGQMGGDGSISHAIERANGYIAQSQGYYPAWVMSDRYARIEVDSLLYTTNAMLKALGPFRHGETLLANCESLRGNLRTGFLDRAHRVIRRRAHLGLKWTAHHFVAPLPKPIRDVVYTAGWAPINIFRHTRDSLQQRLRGKRSDEQ
ncbi:glycosyltransferase [Bifidobacterium sp. 82T24]|uniref:rhamnan synthesis F family protein n=1 Tax=Bifidobacterium pluvialisilvae TaxID=2834436 RepID=UPI001C564151|nr:rhamnan synthesis F family protein [Bifidobacterium pluvialisilvae]MBW3087460.1 glycosyltransferase [Bifidobacterium pluvialisilvae]